MDNLKFTKNELNLMRICIEKYSPALASDSLMSTFYKISDGDYTVDFMDITEYAVGSAYIREGFNLDDSLTEFGLELQNLLNKLNNLMQWQYQNRTLIKKIDDYFKRQWFLSKSKFYRIIRLTIIFGIPFFLVIILIFFLNK